MCFIKNECNLHFCKKHLIKRGDQNSSAHLNHFKSVGEQMSLTTKLDTGTATLICCSKSAPEAKLTLWYALNHILRLYHHSVPEDGVGVQGQRNLAGVSLRQLCAICLLVSGYS
ncbi:hypothetical protein KIL84_015422 [Mauremys mutica]|uniref:Uncharacterized protein n=1 Tax=Mauremys mutica TaxID=74926 RepID=A0A9D3WSE4_9SAUR|nr:hypothetical protein KIL84_015422 [Mauremys mutica]